MEIEESGISDEKFINLFGVQPIFKLKEINNIFNFRFGDFTY